MKLLKIKSYFTFILSEYVLIFSILFSLISHCIPFKESNFDRNGLLNRLILLYQLNEVAKGQEYETKVKFLNNGSIAGDTVIRMTKVSGDYQLPSSGQEDNSGEFVGTFQQASDGFTRIYFPALGRFRLDLYKFPSRQFHGSVLIDLLKSTDTKFSIVEQKYTGNFSYIENTVKRIKKREHEPFEMYTFKDVKTLGTFGGSAYFSMKIIFNKDFKISTSNVYIKSYDMVFYTQDGENFKSFVVSEYPSEASQGTQNFDNSSDVNSFVDAGDFIAGFLTRTISGNDTWYLLKIPKENPAQYSNYQITTRSGAPYGNIQPSEIIYLDQRLIYKEFELANPLNFIWRYDMNFLLSGSSNSPIPNPANNPFTNGNIRFMHNNQIVNSDSTTTYYASDSTINSYTGNYAHTSPLSGTGNLFGNPYKIFLNEYTNVPGDQFRISTTSQPIVNGVGNLNFSGGYTVPYNATIRGTTFNENRTTIFLEYTSGPNINEILTEMNHSDNSFKSLTLPTVTPSMIDFNINFKTNSNCLLTNSKYTCAYKRNYEDPFSVLTSRRDMFLVGSSSVDGLTWSDWKEIVFNPTIRKTD
jgi:hypothetical protein